MTDPALSQLAAKLCEAKRRGLHRAFTRLHSRWVAGVRELQDSGPGGGGGRAGNGAGETLVGADTYREPPSPAPGSYTLTIKQIETLMACPIEIPGCVADTGEFCGDVDGCEHGYVQDHICAECAQGNEADPTAHAEDCSKRAVLEAIAQKSAPGSIRAYFDGARGAEDFARPSIGQRKLPIGIRPAPRSLIGRGVGAVLEIAWLGYQLVRR